MDPIDTPDVKSLQSLRRQLGEVMSRDRARLRGALDRVEARLKSLAADATLDPTVARELTALRNGFDASLAKRKARADSVPAIRLDESLPVAREADRIIDLIRRHRVVVIAGETGSGKTTQLPKLCLAAGRGISGMIGCTQPRRIAARSVARRVAQELGTEVGALVGFQVRFTDQVSDQSLIKFMTDGILLAETQGDRQLAAYDTLIIDEAHERSLNIDFLLGYLKRLLDKRPDLKIIVTSATIDTERFSKHFDDAPVVNVEGRSFPVEVRYRPPMQDRPASPEAARGPAARQALSRAEQRADPLGDAIEEITHEDPLGDILVFLPGEREIRDAHDALSRRKYRETEVLPLYARLSTREQDRIFNPGPKRRIVLTTNVAETSLTVPRIRYVVDSGEARVNRYSHRHKVQRLHIEPISQASADQRRGRCGRVGPGICVRLYDEADYLQRPRYTDPEILRSSLAGVILRMMSLGLGAIEQFPFLDPPSERAVNDGYTQLIELAALGEDRRQLTAIGRQLARLPLDVKLARMLLEADKLGALREMIAITSFLSVQEPRERPPEARGSADAAHAVFADPKSDFVSVLNLWAAYALAHEELTQSKLRDWCETRFLSFLRMREWRELHRQLLLQTSELGWTLGSESASFEAVHRALISGLPGNIGRKDEKNLYHGPRGRRFQLFPGSALAKSPPLWVVSATLLDTQKLFGITNARIEPQWLIEQAAHLVRRAHHDPHWDRKRGQVMAYEQITLFGLTLVERRPVHYGSIDAQAARAIFIREALVPCEIDGKARCIAHNRSVLVQGREEEARQRRHGLLRDEAELAAWWETRLPTDICTANTLDAYTRRATPEQLKSLEWRLEDVLQSGHSDADRFPQHFVQGRERFRLGYVFDPGKPDDGVTLHLPVAWLNAVSPARIGWLVPGMLEAKVAELIRALPKVLRRNFVPAPDFARAFVEATSVRDQSLTATLSAYLKRVTAIEVPASEWIAAEAALPEHLRMRIRLLDERKQLLVEGRDLVALRQQHGERARTAFAEQAAGEIAQEDLRAFPSTPIPESVTAPSGMRAYPALVDRVNRVDLAVFEQEAEARTTHAAGVRRLLRFALAEKVKQVRKQLPLGAKLALAYTPMASPDQLREDIALGALDDLIARDTATARSLESFQLSEQAISRQLSLLAVARLDAVEATLTAYAELMPKIKSSLMGFAKANLDDLREQLSRLVHPGFARGFALERLRELPRYLKAMRLRAERLHNDPRKDQARMLVVRDFEAQLGKISTSARVGGNDGSDIEAINGIRWSIEELRVQLFAQDLGTREAVSEKRIQRAIEALQ